MLKLAINRKPISGPWGGGNNFVKAVYSSVPSDVQLTNVLSDDVDAIFVMDPRKEGSFDINDVARFISKKRVNVFQRINECDARKGTEHMDHMLLQCSTINSKTLFVSNWMKDYFNKKGWACKDQHVLYNGVDDHFTRHAKSLENESDDIIKVVTHHWSNNHMKGFDSYEFIDYLSTKNKRISFTYVGRDRGTFSNTRVISPLHGEELAIELSKHDIYVSGSRHDPGPNHVLEALALRMPTYVHAEGGGACEFAGINHSFSNFVELENLLLKSKHDKNSYIPFGWKESMSRFWSIILQ